MNLGESSYRFEPFTGHNDIDLAYPTVRVYKETEKL